MSQMQLTDTRLGESQGSAAIPADRDRRCTTRTRGRPQHRGAETMTGTFVVKGLTRINRLRRRTLVAAFLLATVSLLTVRAFAQAPAPAPAAAPPVIEEIVI